MNKITADNMVEALTPYRQYLLINEWNNIKDVIYHWVEENAPQKKTHKQREEETPPLRKLWASLWTKTYNTPVGVHIVIFILGIAVGLFAFGG